MQRSSDLTMYKKSWTFNFLLWNWRNKFFSRFYQKIIFRSWKKCEKKIYFLRLKLKNRELNFFCTFSFQGFTSIKIESESWSKFLQFRCNNLKNKTKTSAPDYYMENINFQIMSLMSSFFLSKIGRYIFHFAAKFPKFLLNTFKHTVTKIKWKFNKRDNTNMN